MLRFAIPRAPRQVRLTQVPGAVRRLLAASGLGVVALLVLTALGALLGRWMGREAAFLSAAQPVEAKVLQVHLPPKAERDGAVASATVVYELEGHPESSSVELDALQAEGMGSGARLSLLVDPRDPGAPRAALRVEQLNAQNRFVPFAAALGALGVLLLLARELRRAYRRELEPLRLGALVWMTPEQPLPPGRRAIEIDGHYYRDDVKCAVRARVGPGSGPVRQGDKVLAAVVPREPSWVRVVDESLARTLGWLA